MPPLRAPEGHDRPEATTTTPTAMAAISPNVRVHPTTPGRVDTSRKDVAAMSSTDEKKKQQPPVAVRKRYDPVERYAELEAEMFRLKFERAEHIERTQVRELKDRQGREEIEQLKRKLEELEVDMGGIVVKGREESTVAGNGGDGGSGAGGEAEEVVIEEGLRRKRDKLECANAMLKKDVDNIRSELESERDRTAEVSEHHDRTESDRYRADSEQKGLRSRGERLSSEQSKIQSDCTSMSVALTEVREEKSRAEDEVSGLREKIALLHAEHTKLRMRMDRAREQSRAFRHDAVLSKRHSARVRDRMLAINDPEEYKRQRPERKERRRQEKAADAAWALNERQICQQGRRASLVAGMVGRRHSNEGAARAGNGAAGSVYVPSRHSSLPSVLPGMGLRRRSNDDAAEAAPTQSVCAQSVLPGLGLSLGRSGGGNGAAGPGGLEKAIFLPGSWKRKDNGNDSGMSVVSGLTMETGLFHRGGGGAGPLFGQR